MKYSILNRTNWAMVIVPMVVFVIASFFATAHSVKAATYCAYNSTQASCACPTSGPGVTCIEPQLYAEGSGAGGYCYSDIRPCASTERLNCESGACECNTPTYPCSGCTAPQTTIGAICNHSPSDSGDCANSSQYTGQCGSWTCPAGTTLCSSPSPGSCVTNRACPAGMTWDVCSDTCSTYYVMTNPTPEVSPQPANPNIEGNFTIFGNQSGEGDLYMSNGKAVRVEGAGATTLNVGNWGGGAFTLESYGTVKGDDFTSDTGNFTTSAAALNLGASVETINIGGGSSATGCTVTAAGDYSCTGDFVESGTSLANKYLSYGGYMQNNNPFSPRGGFYITEMYNSFHRGESRFLVTQDGGYSSFSSAALFDNNYENRCQLEPGATGVITIDLLGKGEYGVNGITYPQGYIYVNFYHVRGAENVSGRMQDRNGSWFNMPTTNVSGSSSQQQWRLTVPPNNYIVKFEITVVSSPAVVPNTWVTEIEYYQTRPSGAPLSVFSKYSYNTIYSPLYMRDASNASVTSLDNAGNIIATGDVSVGDELCLRGDCITDWLDSFPPGTSNGDTLRWNGTDWASSSNLVNVGTGVGIGTGGVAPAYALDVRGGTSYFQDEVGMGMAPAATIGVSASGSSYGGYFRSDSGYYTQIASSAGWGIYTPYYGYFGADLRVGVASSDGKLIVRQDNALDIFNLYDGATNVFTVLDGGNVGIKTSSPVYDLDVNGDVRITGTLTVEGSSLITGGGSANYVPRFTSASNIANSSIYDNGANIGIGTTTPAYKMSVAGDTYTTGGIGFGGRTPNLFTNGRTFSLAGQSPAQDDGAAILYGTGAYATNYTELMRQSYAIVSNSHIYTTGNLYSYGHTYHGDAATDNGYWKGTNQYIYNDLHFRDNDTSATIMFLDDDNQRVGVGTATPAYSLDVAGTVNATSLRLPTGATAGYALVSDATGNATWQALGGIGGGGTANYVPKFSAAATLTDSQIFDNGSNVGIGTVTPSAALHVASTANPGLQVGNGTTGYAKIGATGWYDDGTYFSPMAGRPLYVRSDVGVTYLYSPTTFLGSTAGQNIRVRDNQMYGDDWIINAGGAGNWGIGTNAPAYRLDVVGDTQITGQLRMMGNIKTDRFLDQDSNTFIGMSAAGAGNLSHIAGVNGWDNTFIGFNSGYAVTTGSRNTFVGNASGQGITTGTSNTAMGYMSGRSITTGLDNVLIGEFAGSSVVDGYSNVAVGYSAGGAVTSGFWNVFVGQRAGAATTSSRNTMVGDSAGRYTTTGESNAFFGNSAGQQNTTGYDNAYIGPAAGINAVTGYRNSCVGRFCLGNTSSGYLNVTFGYNAGSNITSGNNNIMIGPYTQPTIGSAVEQLNIGDAIYGDMSVPSIGIGAMPDTIYAFDVLGKANADEVCISGVCRTTWPTVSGGLSGSGTTYGTAVWSGASALASVGPGVAGQLLVSQGASANPAYVTLSGDATMSSTGTLTIANNSHTHTTSTISGLDASNDFSAGVLAVIYGGTGLTSVGSEGDVFTVSGGNPKWLPAPAPSGVASGDLSGTYPSPSVVNDSHSHTGATISGLDAALDISSGTLPIARGGTNATTYTASQFLWYNGTSLVASGYSNSSFAAVSHNHSAANITSGILAVARGGTGATSLTDLIDLGSHTTGDYVKGISAGAGISITGSGGEGSTPVITATGGGSLWTENSGNVYRSSGNVGIGTTTPIYELDVAGSGRFNTISTGGASVSSSYGIRTQGATMGGAFYDTTGTYLYAGYANWGIYTPGNGYLGGNVGIGTTSPSYSLDVNGTTQTTAFRMPTGAGAGYIFTSDASGNASWAAPSIGDDPPASWWNRYPKYGAGGFSARSVIYDNGTNIGIGTITPSQILDVVGNVNVSQTISTGGASISSSYGIRAQGSTMGGYFKDTDGTYAYVGYGSRAIYSSGGAYFGDAVGIGTTSPVGMLQVIGDANVSGKVFGNYVYANYGAVTLDWTVGGTLYSDGVLDASSASGTVAYIDRNNTAGGYHIYFRQNGSYVGGVYNNGSGTLSYNTFTGSHPAWTDEVVEEGLLVSLTGNNRKIAEDSDDYSEPIYGVVTTTTENDSSVLGSYLSQPSEEDVKLDIHNVMAVGNGFVWVVDEGSDIRVGDFLVSSSTPGHARLDSEEYPISHVVAMASETVDWSEVSEIAPDGKKHKIISITFERFDRMNLKSALGDMKLSVDGRFEVIDKRVTNLEKENVELKGKMEKLEGRLEQLEWQMLSN